MTKPLAPSLVETEPSIGQPIPHAGVEKISPYVPGSSKGTTVTRHKLSSNETPLGASPAAITAYQALAGQLDVYPDGAATELRHAIGEVHDLDPDRILCGCGSDEILSLITLAFCQEGDEVIHTEHGFLVYRLAALNVNAEPVSVPEKDFTADLDAVLEAVTERTKVIFLANPNNPTGTYVSDADVRAFHAKLPAGVLLVLDGAYAEYVNRNDYESGLALASSAPNVLTTRTFSKLFGLAGLRIGWCYGAAPLIDALNRVRGPFNVASPNIAAGAAAIRDRDHVARAVTHNSEWLPIVTAALEKLGLSVTPSVGNFILIHFPDLEGKRASDADRYLLDMGLVLRRVVPYGLPNALRMTIGSAEANQEVIAALTEFMAA